MDRIWMLLREQPGLLIFWGGLALLTIALLALMRTQWGRNRPLRKCAVLSLIVHALLLSYAATIRIVYAPGVHSQADHVMRVMTIEPSGEESESPAPVPAELPAWDRFAAALVPQTPGDEAPPAEAEVRLPAARRETGDPPPIPPDPAPLPPLAGPAVRSTPGVIVAGGSTEPDRAVATAEPLESPRTAQRDAAVPRPQTDVSPQPARTLAEAPRTAEAPPPSGLTAPVLDDESPVRQAAETAAAAPTERRSVEVEVAAAAAAAPTLVAAEPATSSPASLQPGAMLGRPELDPIQPAVAKRVGEDATDPASTASDTPDLGSAVLVRRQSEHDVPEAYQLRVAVDRQQIVEDNGGSARTETAVQMALRWLAANQSADGRWEARRHGAGQGGANDGRDRENAGARADSGVTGLALLAFLGAGYTHQDGPYAAHIQSALDYLRRIQGPDGNLSGNAELYAAMYCHGMSTFALAEAYGMTGDRALQPALQRAIAYTLSAQHPATGGWRYKPGDVRGDTSQLGWQLLALKSAELGGMELPVRARQGMLRFLHSVSAGQHGGLTSYREGERVSRPMTAEGLYCRLVLGGSPDSAASREAAEYVLGELPGAGETNYYYWYYGTLALYQMQGEAWKLWNQALQDELIRIQVTSGDLAGSWPTSSTWGGYGGRVYSTAMAALSLEVYYRYRPWEPEIARGLPNSLPGGLRRQ